MATEPLVSSRQSLHHLYVDPKRSRPASRAWGAVLAFDSHCVPMEPLPSLYCPGPGAEDELAAFGLGLGALPNENIGLLRMVETL